MFPHVPSGRDQVVPKESVMAEACGSRTHIPSETVQNLGLKISRRFLRLVLQIVEGVRVPPVPNQIDGYEGFRDSSFCHPGHRHSCVENALGTIIVAGK